MRLRKKMMLGAMAAMGAVAQPASIGEKDREPPAAFDLTDPASAVSNLIGIPRSEVEASYKTNLENFVGIDKPTLIIGAQSHLVDHPEVRYHTHEIEKSQRGMVPLILSLHHRGKISCVFHESVVDEEAESQVIADVRKMISFLRDELKYLDKRPTISILEELDNGNTQRLEQVFDGLSLVIGLIEKGGKENLVEGEFDMTTYHLLAPITNDLVNRLFVAFSVVLPEFEEKYGKYKPRINDLKQRMSHLWTQNGTPNSHLIAAPVYLRVFTDIPVKICPTMSREVEARWNQAKKDVAATRHAPTPFDEQERAALERIRELLARLDVLNRHPSPRETIPERLRILNSEIPRAEISLLLARENIRKVRESMLKEKRGALDIVEIDERNRDAVSFILNSEFVGRDTVFFLQIGREHVRGIGNDMVTRPKDKQMNVISIEPK
jgi:hypothetical protein